MYKGIVNVFYYFNRDLEHILDSAGGKKAAEYLLSLFSLSL